MTFASPAVATAGLLTAVAVVLYRRLVDQSVVAGSSPVVVLAAKTVGYSLPWAGTKVSQRVQIGTETNPTPPQRVAADIAEPEPVAGG